MSLDWVPPLMNPRLDTFGEMVRYLKRYDDLCEMWNIFDPDCRQSQIETTMKNVRLRHLRYVIALAEELHFGRAATRLKISQPLLSRNIHQIEQELGVSLFSRTSRQIRLTEAGERFVNEARKALVEFE